MWPDGRLESLLSQLPDSQLTPDFAEAGGNERLKTVSQADDRLTVFMIGRGMSESRT
jgi:hypothetical protein